MSVMLRRTGLLIVAAASLLAVLPVKASTFAYSATIDSSVGLGGDIPFFADGTPFVGTFSIETPSADNEPNPNIGYYEATIGHSATFGATTLESSGGGTFFVQDLPSNDAFGASGYGESLSVNGLGQSWIWSILYSFNSGGTDLFATDAPEQPFWTASSKTMMFSLYAGQGNSRQYFATISSIAPVPVPAALPLMVGGLGLLGFMSWRKKRKEEQDRFA